MQDTLKTVFKYIFQHSSSWSQLSVNFLKDLLEGEAVNLRIISFEFQQFDF